MAKANPKHARKPSQDSNRWSSIGYGVPRPLAVDLDQVAELLAIPRPMAARLARDIEPYRHADGSARWPLRELARALADCGGVRTRAELGP